MRYIVFILALMFIALIILFPSVAKAGALDAISTWFEVLIPCLMPYCIAANILVNTGVLSRLSKPLNNITKKTFGFSGSFSYVFISSLLSGYPSGANLCGELYSSGMLSSKEASAMINSTSLCGPSFIISAVASGMLKNMSLAKYIFLPHLSSTLILAFINGKSQKKEAARTPALSKPFSFAKVLSCSVSKASLAMLNVLGFTVILSVISEIITHLFKNFFSSHALIHALFCGIIEMTKGCRLASKLDVNTALIIISFCVSFGGISVICQTMSAALSYGIKPKRLIPSKLMQGLLSALFTYLYLSVCPPVLSVFFKKQAAPLTGAASLVISLFIILPSIIRLKNE